MIAMLRNSMLNEHMSLRVFKRYPKEFNRSCGEDLNDGPDRIGTWAYGVRQLDWLHLYLSPALDDLSGC